jgi:acyl-coenzyme A synthetase/AMP-(fatty) acid ligase
VTTEQQTAEDVFHKEIRKLEFIDQIPKSASGKILRRVLVERERAGLARTRS